MKKLCLVLFMGIVFLSCAEKKIIRKEIIRNETRYISCLTGELNGIEIIIDLGDVTVINNGKSMLFPLCINSKTQNEIVLNKNFDSIYFYFGRKAYQLDKTSPELYEMGGWNYPHSIKYPEKINPGAKIFVLTKADFKNEKENAVMQMTLDMLKIFVKGLNSPDLEKQALCVAEVETTKKEMKNVLKGNFILHQKKINIPLAFNIIKVEI